MRSLSFSYLPLDQWFLARGDFALKDHLAVFGDLFFFFSFLVTTWGMVLLAFSG